MSNKNIDSVWVSRASVGNVKETHAGLSPYAAGVLGRVVIHGWDKIKALDELESLLVQAIADVKALREEALDEYVLECLASDPNAG